MNLTPDELRRAYAAGAESPGDEHPSAESLARFVSADVTDAQRSALADHVARCACCAEEVRVGLSIHRGLAGDRPSFRPAPRPMLLVLAAAACLVLAAGIALGPLRPRPTPESPFRSAGDGGITSRLAPSETLARAGGMLRWSGAPPEATFDVLLANESLDVLAKFAGVREARLAVPPGVLARIPRGGRLVWQVTAVLPDGTRSESRSFSNAVE